MDYTSPWHHAAIGVLVLLGIAVSLGSLGVVLFGATG